MGFLGDGIDRQHHHGIGAGRFIRALVLASVPAHEQDVHALLAFPLGRLLQRGIVLELGKFGLVRRLLELIQRSDIVDNIIGYGSGHNKQDAEEHP
ncbi:hypothetical protein BN871_AZ_00080 [Paenibacillus sp. P22]|nr:hypothetical protein BN871_AZ_00080 [Paenibacillus sp. P22]